MLDALCQGIESWWSVNSTDESKEYSKIAVETIMQNWRPYIFEDDDNAAEQIMLASNYAGRAINIAQTTAPHAFSYKLTSLYGIPHGHAVAVCLPVIWSYMVRNLANCIDIRGMRYVISIFSGITISVGCLSIDQAIIKLYQMMEAMDLANLVSINREEDLIILSSAVNKDRMKNNPVLIDDLIIYDLYEQILYSMSY